MIFLHKIEESLLCLLATARQEGVAGTAAVTYIYDFMNFFYFFSGYYGILLLACVLTGCLLVRKSWAPWYKLLVILSGATLLAETLSFVCSVKHINYLPWYTVWVFLEALTLLYILSREVMLRSVRRLYRILMILSPLGVVAYFVLSPAFAYVGLYILFLELIAACAALIDILKDVSERPMYGMPKFWLATGLLFFCSFYIVIFSIGQLLNALSYICMPLMVATNTFMYAGYIACFKALRKEDRQKNPVTSAA